MSRGFSELLGYACSLLQEDIRKVSAAQSLSHSPVAVLQLLVFPYKSLYLSVFVLMTLLQTSSQLFLATMNFLSHLSQSFAARHWAIQGNYWGGRYATAENTRCC